MGHYVNNIMPGYTRTERLEDWRGCWPRRRKSTYGNMGKGNPHATAGEPREFAALAAFLVSERASYITGTSIPVDGGWIRALL